MDKKLDRIIEMIQEIKNEDVNKHIDKLRSILRTLEDAKHYNFKESDPDFKDQLHLAKSELSYLKEYFLRHTNIHAESKEFKNYMIFLTMCFIADYKIDTNMNQVSLARKNLKQVKDLIITYSPPYLDSFPENKQDVKYFNYLKNTVDGYLYDLDKEYLIKNNIVDKESVIIELDVNEVKEVYKLLDKKFETSDN